MVSLVIGCNYHTRWQRHKAMRFVLCEVKGDRARLKTRRTGKEFWTDCNDLIFIASEGNHQKRLALREGSRIFDEKSMGSHPVQGA